MHSRCSLCLLVVTLAVAADAAARGRSQSRRRDQLRRRHEHAGRAFRGDERSYRALELRLDGGHYAQIKNGAPFEAFFAADTERPRLLESEGIAVPGSRFLYAVGRVALWSARADHVDTDGKVLDSGDFRHLAIANPELAPYGAAARDVLTARGLWDRLQPRLVTGQDIGQTYSFVQTGNAELGFVAWSQLKQPNGEIAGSYWLVPESLHRPIEQEAVLLRDVPAARALLEFIKSAEAREIIRSYGYGP
jgi:molybdate transport system substrate-binding protein